MKKLMPTALIALVSVAFASCSDESPSFVGETALHADKSGKTVPDTRANDEFETNWENMQSVTLSNGEKLSLPWEYDSETAHHIEVRKDVKKEDGWVMLAHSMNRPIYQNISLNYFALYNMASGDIKIFINTNEKPTAHNSAVWTVYFSKPQGWMNSLNEVSLPTTYQFKPTFIWETSIYPIKGNSYMEKGWNILTIPNVAYDPNAPGELGILIGSKAYTSTLVELFSETEGEIDGKLFTVGSKNPTTDLQSTLVSYTGKAAEYFAKKILNVPTDETRGLSGLLAKGIGALVKNGAKEKLNSFFAKASIPTYSEVNVRLNLHASTTTKGKLVTHSSTGFPSTGFEIGKDSTGIEIGAWNLTDNPTIYLHPVGVMHWGFNNNNDEGEYRFTASGNFKADVLINPQLLPHLIVYDVDCTVVKYSAGDEKNLPQIPVSDYVNSDYGTLGAYRGTSTYMDFYDHNYIIYSNDKYSILNDKAQGLVTYWKIWQKYGKYSSQRPNYKYIYAPGNRDICRGYDIKIGCYNHYAKVMVTMVTEFEGKRDTIVTSRTYKPKFEWDPEMVKTYSGVSMQDLQNVAGRDNILKEIDSGYYDNLYSGYYHPTNETDSVSTK